MFIGRRTPAKGRALSEEGGRRRAIGGTLPGIGFPGVKVRRLPGTKVRRLPGARVRALPGAKVRGLPGTKGKALPSAKVRGLPGTKGRALPGRESRGDPHLALSLWRGQRSMPPGQGRMLPEQGRMLPGQRKMLLGGLQLREIRGCQKQGKLLSLLQGLLLGQLLSLFRIMGQLVKLLQALLLGLLLGPPSSLFGRPLGMPSAFP